MGTEQPSPGLVLVADDVLVNLEVLSSTLESAGIEVSIATDGPMVLERLEYETPDLILLDVTMPGMTGFDVCERLKSSPATADIPVIFTTAHAAMSDKLRGFRLGAVDYVTKPFERDELLARVKTQLALRRALTSLARKNAELENEIEVRAAAQTEFVRLADELERRVEERTEALARAVAELERAKESLEETVARRTRELQRANERLERELAERAALEEARSALQAQIIAAQAARLAELSTPIIPISDQILVMPLIGMVDEERAQGMVDAATMGVSGRRAAVMILDITGVSRVDARVAQALLRAARAVRLLGAQVVITGIRPEVARELVALGAEMTEMVTQSTLQGGIAYAMSKTRSPPRRATNSAARG
ncbi:response regulator [Sorangium sp. So ce1014]|uniref:response regulator n=1 Tax=Sorangium sp. So ce1014 TaxID=3133326 RepID=UPI003F6250B2